MQSVPCQGGFSRFFSVSDSRSQHSVFARAAKFRLNFIFCPFAGAENTGTRTSKSGRRFLCPDFDFAEKIRLPIFRKPGVQIFLLSSLTALIRKNSAVVPLRMSCRASSGEHHLASAISSSLSLMGASSTTTMKLSISTSRCAW